MRERERNINVWLPLVHPPLRTWPATHACALTGNQTGDPPETLDRSAKRVSGMPNLLASVGHTVRIRVVFGHKLNILQHIITHKKSHNVLSKFMTLCWAVFTAILSSGLQVGLLEHFRILGQFLKKIELLTQPFHS